MTEPISRLVVEQVDTLGSRSRWIFVTGVLSGEPISIGDTLAIRHSDGPAAATVRTIEMHSAPGRTTIALDSALELIVSPGTILERLATS